MSKTKSKYPNHLTQYRERLGLSREHLAVLAGCRRAQTIRRMENGSTLPGVVTVFRLSAALRVPVEFLYHETYLGVREKVRSMETEQSKGQQGVLPLPL